MARWAWSSVTDPLLPASNRCDRCGGLRGSYTSPMRRLVLCGRLAVLCALAVGASQPLAGQPAHVADSWRDAAPHRAGWITRNGVRLHYLDWGGNGPAVVLLPGFSLTAHAFDEIATALSPKFRVIAVTPRGYGESDAPDTSAYTIETMVADLRALLDSLALRRVALVGHSISGSVIAAFAEEHPERVSKLVFLDAFPYIHPEVDSISALTPVREPPFAGDTTFKRVRAWLTSYRFGSWNAALEADFRVKPMGAEGARRRGLVVHYIADSREHVPDVAALRVPALQLCAMPTMASEYPWLRDGSTDYARARTYLETTMRPFLKRLCSRFARTVPRGQTREVVGSHYVFFISPVSTAQLIKSYLDVGG